MQLPPVFAIRRTPGAQVARSPGRQTDLVPRPTDTLPFDARHERLGRDGAFDSQDAVEMIDLMLKQFGKTIVGFERDLFPLLVEVRNVNSFGAGDLDQKLRKTQTVVPDRNTFSTFPRYLS